MNNPPPPPATVPGTPPALNLKIPKKSRASLKMKEGLRLSKATRSAQLTSALIKFDAWVANISELRESVIQHHTLLRQSNDRKAAMYKKLGEVYLNNGISVADGKTPANPISVALNSIKDSVVGLLTDGGVSQAELQPNTAPFLLDKFSTHCITYLSHYITHVSALRVAFDKIDVLRRENDHYQKKVDELQVKFLKKQQKAGTSMSEDDKLVRNRQKLAKASLMYTSASEILCKAVDLVVDNGWKEVQGIALKIMQFERMYSGPFGTRVAETIGPWEVKLAEAGKEHFVKYDPNFIRIDEIFEVVSRSFIEKEGGSMPTSMPGSTPMSAAAAGGGVEERDRGFSADSGRGSEEAVKGEENKKSKKRWSMFGGGKKKDTVATDGAGANKSESSIAGPTSGSAFAASGGGGAPPLTPFGAAAQSGLAPPTEQPSWANGVGDSVPVTTAARTIPITAPSTISVVAPTTPGPKVPPPQAAPSSENNRLSSDFASATTPWADFNSKGGEGGQDAFGTFDNFSSPPAPQQAAIPTVSTVKKPDPPAPVGISPVVSPASTEGGGQETGGFTNFASFGTFGGDGDQGRYGDQGGDTATSTPKAAADLGGFSAFPTPPQPMAGNTPAFAASTMPGDFSAFPTPPQSSIASSFSAFETSPSPAPAPLLPLASPPPAVKNKPEGWKPPPPPPKERVSTGNPFDDFVADNGVGKEAIFDDPFKDM
ncbi:hypothetical protein TrCOL_g435 [Triparma columacea]|uniref:Uncharacterized protein n=1 Tax=Triparma columacea TaxID=722753 RepID=A0A9W7G5Q2_9STRA|nr:hypothetical protein TrCOL_g435 [Triparma columacea]